MLRDLSTGHVSAAIGLKAQSPSNVGAFFVGLVGIYQMVQNVSFPMHSRYLNFPPIVLWITSTILKFRFAVSPFHLSQINLMTINYDYLLEIFRTFLHVSWSTSRSSST